MDTAEKKKIEAENGDVVYAKLGGVEFAFRKPNQTDYEEFQAQMQKDRAHGVAWSRELCLKSLITPSVEELEAMFRRYPAAPPSIALELEKLSGSDVELTTKKG